MVGGVVAGRCSRRLALALARLNNLAPCFDAVGLLPLRVRFEEEEEGEEDGRVLGMRRREQYDTTSAAKRSISAKTLSTSEFRSCVYCVVLLIFEGWSEGYGGSGGQARGRRRQGGVYS